MHWNKAYIVITQGIHVDFTTLREMFIYKLYLHTLDTVVIHWLYGMFGTPIVAYAAICRGSEARNYHFHVIIVHTHVPDPKHSLYITSHDYSLLIVNC